MNLRRYLIAGLLVWIPIGFTLFVLKLVIGLMDQTLLLLPVAYRPENLFGIHIPGLGIVLSIAVLLVTGMLVANFLGKRLVSFSERLLNILFTNASQAFKKVLLIEYPRKGIYTLCFQTSTELAEIQVRTGREVVCVFVPTTPNPTSGFIMMVPAEDVIELDMDVESALKMIVSLGVVVPRWVREKHAIEAGTDAPAE